MVSGYFITPCGLMWLYHPIAGYMDSIDAIARDGINKLMDESFLLNVDS
jgi:hypothetical protein